MSKKHRRAPPRAGVRILYIASAGFSYGFCSRRVRCLNRAQPSVRAALMPLHQRAAAASSGRVVRGPWTLIGRRRSYSALISCTVLYTINPIVRGEVALEIKSGGQNRCMKTVMLIDDSEADLLFSSIVVSRSGICDDVLEFDSAASALDHLKAPQGSQVDLILLDINMPGMNGFDFLKAYQLLQHANAARAAVVMLTSSPDPHDRQQAESFGCVRGYVVKPINLAATQRLQALLDAPSPPGG